MAGGHLGGEGMAAFVRCDFWHLHTVNLVVSVDHVAETVLPVKGHFRKVVLVKIQEPAVTTYHLLDLRSLISAGLKILLNSFPEAYSLTHIDYCALLIKVLIYARTFRKTFQYACYVFGRFQLVVN